MRANVFSAVSLLFSQTDEEAMLRVKMSDDHQEFARLVKRWEEPIRRLCSRMTGDPHSGEDLKQETFSRLFEKRGQYQPGGRFSTYLWRIALNSCYDHLRRGNARPNLDSAAGRLGQVEEHPAETLPPDMEAAREEEGEYVRQALMQLPEIYRAVLVLRHYENLKLSKIAEILDVPVGTVNSRIAEALVRMSRMLGPMLGVRPQPARTSNPPIKPTEACIL